MRRSLLTTLFCICSLFAVCAQSEHLTFKGIPITGAPADIAQQLKAIGYTSIHQDLILQGQFSNELCDIYISATQKSNTAYSVTAAFPNEDSWSTLRRTYFDLKNSLTEKYGEPFNYIEKFESPYYNGDGYELSALRHSKCRYLTLWKTERGNILLRISYFDSKHRIMISYIDKTGNEINEFEERQAIQSDL